MKQRGLICLKSMVAQSNWLAELACVRQDEDLRK